MSKLLRLTFFTVIIAFIASLGGLLFGYNTSVISGAILFLSKEFAFSKLNQAMIVSILLIGALIGALCGGYLSDGIGRKKTLFSAVLLFVVGTIVLIIAHSLGFFLLGRFIVGLGVGIVSVTVPLYIAEISPTHFRGTLVSFNQLAITVGILLAYVIDYLFARESNWQAMFAFALVPSVIFFIGLFFIPETPSYLAGIGRKKRAQQIMHKISGRAALETIDLEGKAEKVKPISLKHLVAPKVRKAFITGIGISVFQQITGINVVIYYAPQIFQLAGYTSAPSAILATIGIGVINVIVTLAALVIIDRVGRKPLLITSLIGMAISLFILGISFFEKKQDLGLVSMVSLMAYVSFFAIGLGPVTWLIISEIFPLSIRGRAMGIAIFANWLCNYFVSLTFLNLIMEITTSGALWLYTGICLFGLWFVCVKVPETKNKTFEEIQKFWEKEPS
jgi:MFS transporter, SP family, galactose:H+ symporter